MSEVVNNSESQEQQLDIQPEQQTPNFQYFETGYDDVEAEDDYLIDDLNPDGTRKEVITETDESGEESDADDNSDVDAKDGDQVFKGAVEVPEVAEAASQLSQGFSEYQNTVAATIEAGKITQETVSAIEAEFDATGALSQESYDKLAEAGFPKLFVDSYIQGTQATQKQYVQGIINMCGGNEGFKQLCEHLDGEGTLEAFQEAVVSQNIPTVNAFMKMAASSLTTKFGKKAARSLTASNFVPSAPAAKREEIKPFESKAEWLAAIKDPMYSKDSRFNAMVSKRLSISKF